MTKLLDLLSRLTPADLRKVEDYAASLAASSKSCAKPELPRKRIDVKGLMGLCEGMGGDKSDDELIREAWDATTRER